MLALEGIRILDFSGGYPPALGTKILGDHGAEVINIEGRPPIFGQQAQPESAEIKKAAAYDTVNRNKKSIGLNLKTEEARQIFYRLAESADVIVDPFRPGVTKKLGVDYETIYEINPGIIYCSVTGYGQDGPYANMSGHDINYISIAGALNLIGEAGQRPVVPLNLLADIAGAALHTAIAILIAITTRTKTGRGQYIDVSYTDTVISLLTYITSNYFRTNKIPVRGSAMIPPSPCYDIYETKDGKLITIGCVEPWLWENLCRAINKEEFIPYNMARVLLADPGDDDKWKEIRDFLTQHFLTKTGDEWFELLAAQDVPIGKVNSLDEVFNDPQVLHREMVIEVEHPAVGKIKQEGISIKLSDTPGKVRSLPPTPGEHTHEILTTLDYNDQEIKELLQEKIVT